MIAVVLFLLHFIRSLSNDFYQGVQSELISSVAYN